MSRDVAIINRDEKAANERARHALKPVNSIEIDFDNLAFAQGNALTMDIFFQFRTARLFPKERETVAISIELHILEAHILLFDFAAAQASASDRHRINQFV